MRGGAYSNIAIRTETRELSTPDARQAQALAFGTLRHLRRIDRALSSVVRRPRLDPEVEDLLRVAVFDLLLSPTPDYVAVHEAVEAVKAGGRGHAAGFVNGVLRTLGREGEPVSEPGVPQRSLELGVSEWLYAELIDQFGVEEAEAFLAASLADAPLTVRARPGAPEPPSGAVPVPGIADCYVFPPGPVTGRFVVQDPASVAVGWATHAQPGELVLDVAAAPGGKTLHLFDQMAKGSGSPPEIQAQGSTRLVAMDRHSGRVERARRRAPALWTVADGTRPPFRPETFDLVLLDAPCTGLGTLRRRPELRHRVTPDEVERLAALQRRMLTASAGLVKPGGRLVYSVCTVTSTETVEVVADFEARAPTGLPGRPWGKGWLMGPHLTGTDAMFIAEVLL